MYSFPNFEPVRCSMSGSNCCFWPAYRFLRRQAGWSGIPISLRIFHSLLWSTQSKVFSSVQFSHSVISYSLRPHEPQHARPPCPSLTPRVNPNPCPLSRWCHSTISSSVVPFSSCPQSFPPSASFQMRQLFTSGSQSIGISASISVLPMNTQDWSPWGWISWISLQSKGLSRVFSNTTVRKHQFFHTQPSLCFKISNPYMTNWKSRSSDYTDLCWHSDVSAF